MKRVLSFLMVFVLVLGLVPVVTLPAYAIVDTIYEDGVATYISYYGDRLYYCADGSVDRITMLKTDGTWINCYVENKSVFPKNLTVANDTIYFMSDKDKKSIVAYSTSGGYVSNYNMNLNSPRDVAVDSKGNIYVAESSRIAKRATNGEVSSWNNITGQGIGCATVNGNVRVYVANNNCVMRYDDDGKKIATYMGFNGANAVAADSSGNAFVSNSGDASVKKIDANGNITTVATGLGILTDITVDESGNIYVSSGHIIKKISRSDTTFSVAAETGKISYGTPITLKVFGLNNDSTGTVSVSVDGTQLESKTVSGNSATWDIGNAYAFGSHTIEATYSGDSNYNTAHYTGAFEILKSLEAATISSIRQ